MTVLGTKANVEKVFDAAEAALKEEGVESRAVVDIESSKGQCVIGQVGAWRESYKSLTIRPMGRADKGENIKVVITGKDERAVNQAKAKINDFVQALVAVNLEGSAEAVQKLIKGRNALSRQYVELRNATREVHMDPKESSIALVGPRKNVFDIKSKVQELMTKAALEPVEIRVEESQKRIFSNTALKEMSEQTGAEISRDNAKCCLVIIGDTGAIEKAQAAIQELIDNNGAQESLPTTNASVRALLGKPDKSLDARNKINECEAKYSVAIDLVKVEQKVNILGSKENVAKAKADLESFMASADKAEADMTKKEVDIADDDAPRIIGKQGSTIRSIRDECGVQASLDKDTKKLELKGSAENVEKALEMIKRILTREPREPREDKGKGKGKSEEKSWEPREDKGRGKGRGRVLEAADGSSRSCFATEKPERAEKPKAPKREAYKHDEELFPSLAGPSSKTKSKNSEE
jgi:rRNA processing protein Krr1/Pno1